MDNYIWLSVKQIASLTNVSERFIQKKIENNEVIFKSVPSVGRNGKKYLIALESMAESVQQDFFKGQELEDNIFINSLSEKEREKLYFKYRVVMEYQKYKSTSHSEGRLNAFLKDFSKQNPAAELTKNKVHLWERKYFSEGIKGLYDSRGIHKKGNTTIPDQAWETFYHIWFNCSNVSVQQCYEMTCEKHKNDFPDMPSVYAFRRKLQQVPQSIKILRNNGKKAFNDSCMPFIDVDYDSLSSNQQWVADHHVFDVLVEDDKGRIFRPWLTAWLDRKSRYIVGYEINDCEPNSDIVLRSFAKSCRKSGIPNQVLLDNGKDFKTYDLFNNSNAMSVAQQMGIKVTNAIVKNAKAKPIERYFRTLEEKYLSTLPCYIAGKPNLRPEKMNMTNKKLKLKGLCISYSKFLEIADLMIREANNAVHTGKGMSGKTPYEVYMANFTNPVRMVKNNDVLNLLFQRTSRPIKVGRNGIKVPAIGFYYDDDRLIDWFGKEVFARYNSDDISKVFVYSTDDRFICTAECNELAQLGTQASMDLIREYNRRKKERRERLKEFIPGKDYYTLEEFLKSREADYKEFDVNDADATIQIVPVKHKHLEEISQEKEAKEKEADKTITSYEKERKKRDVDKALYEFIKEAGG